MFYNQFEPSRNYLNNGQTIISIQAAIEIANNQIDGQVIKAELDTENGFIVYEVAIITTQGITYQIEIDAITGEVLRVEFDRRPSKY